jgi:GNAT superfamily N-acetyltransferase
MQSREKLEEQMALGLSVLAFITLTRDLPMFVGHGTTYSLGKDENNNEWWEVGTLIVDPFYRGHGIGNELCRHISQLNTNDYLTPTTKNPLAVAAFRKAGFDVWSYDTVPNPIKDGLCWQAPCYTPTNGNASSCVKEHNKGGPCVVLVRPPLSK